MDFFVDNQGQQLLVSRDATTPASTLRLGETAIDTISVWLLDRAGLGQPLTPAAIPAGFTDLILAGRPAENLEGADLLFSCTAFAAVGAGATLHYEGTLSLNVAALTAALSGLKSLAVLIDIDIQNADATRKRPLVIQAPAQIYRAIYRGTEGAPTSGDPAYPLPQYVPRAYPAITALTGGGAAALDGLATTGSGAPRLVIVSVAGAPRIWELVAGTTASNPAGGIVRPADYDGATNAKFWRALF